MSGNLHRIAGGIAKRERDNLVALAQAHCHFHPGLRAVAYIEDWAGTTTFLCGPCSAQGIRLGHTVVTPAPAPTDRQDSAT